MYRCKDCGLEYKEKTEYCECGNNTFDFIDEPVLKKEKKRKQPLTLEQKSEIVSRLFLLVCIIFSIIVWLIPVKTQQVEEKVKTITTNYTMPSIDKIWDSTPPKVVEPDLPKQEVINDTPIPLTPIPNYTQPKVTSPQKSSAPKKTETKKADVKKTETPKAIPKAVQQPVQQNKLSQTVPKQPQSPVQLPAKPIQEQVKKEPVQTKPVYNPNSSAMLQYKGSLRAAMFSKFPVGSISGSGTCSVHFSVDSTGKLVNRGFTRQSDNKSLNDAVYYMMMSVPKFTPPPSEYNGETISMTFKIDNGSYEISIY